MNFLRNPEIKRDIAIWLMVIIVFSAAAFFIVSLLGCCFVLSASLILFVMFLHTEYCRYSRTAQLAGKIDGVLFHNETFDFAEFNEGDLAVLQSEIIKMTVRIREQSERLQTDKSYLADLITDISHQIRTPLTSVHLICSFLEESGLTEKRRHELIGELSKLLQRMEWLIEALLKMSKLDAGTANMIKSEIRLDELIHASIAPLAIITDIKNQKFQLDIQETSAFSGDLHWQTEAVGNIIKNCVEHTPEGGIISVSGRENAIFTEIIIRDNGSGIDPCDLPHLFERFYKGKNSDESSVGVGLALSRMIINAQNGTVKAENNKNGGAQFTIKYYKGVC